jgi:hypothetical protein
MRSIPSSICSVMLANGDLRGGKPKPGGGWRKGGLISCGEVAINIVGKIGRPKRP